MKQEQARPEYDRRVEVRKRRAGVPEKWREEKIVASLRTGLAGVDRFDVPERVRSGVQVKVTDAGARRSHPQPVIKRDRGKVT